MGSRVLRRSVLVVLGWMTCGLALQAQGATQTLVIGDSHMMGGLGTAVHEGLKALYKRQVTTVASGGTRPWQWVGDPSDTSVATATNRRDSKIPSDPDFLNADSPRVVATSTVPLVQNLLKELEATAPVDQVVIEHGTNILGFWKWKAAVWNTPEGRAQLVGWLTQKISPLLNALDGRRCAWIGVPKNNHAVAKTEALATALGEAIAAWEKNTGGRCAYINSLELRTKDGKLLMPQLKNTPDGYHFSEADGRKWGNAALEVLRDLW